MSLNSCRRHRPRWSLGCCRRQTLSVKVSCAVPWCLLPYPSSDPPEEAAGGGVSGMFCVLSCVVSEFLLIRIIITIPIVLLTYRSSNTPEEATGGELSGVFCTLSSVVSKLVIRRTAVTFRFIRKITSKAPHTKLHIQVTKNFVNWTFPWFLRVIV
jgi:heme/copper-type cytochrome/quinol oxidase subunit 2